MARHTLFVVPGTWEIPSGAGPDTPCGLLAPYAHELDRNVFDVRFVNYPAKFGPIAAGGTFAGLTGDPSYLVSRDQGVEELKRLINETPGTFGIAGFLPGRCSSRSGCSGTGGRRSATPPEGLHLGSRVCFAAPS